MALKKLDSEALARKKNRLNAEDDDEKDAPVPMEAYVLFFSFFCLSLFSCLFYIFQLFFVLTFFFTEVFFFFHYFYYYAVISIDKLCQFKPQNGSTI